MVDTALHSYIPAAGTSATVCDPVVGAALPPPALLPACPSSAAGLLPYLFASTAMELPALAFALLSGVPVAQPFNRPFLSTSIRRAVAAAGNELQLQLVGGCRRLCCAAHWHTVAAHPADHLSRAESFGEDGIWMAAGAFERQPTTRSLLAMQLAQQLQPRTEQQRHSTPRSCGAGRPCLQRLRCPGPYTSCSSSTSLGNRWVSFCRCKQLPPLARQAATLACSAAPSMRVSST